MDVLKQSFSDLETVVKKHSDRLLSATDSIRNMNDEEIKEALFEEVPIDVKVLSYAPRVFRFIRAIDGVEEVEVMKSISPATNKVQIFKTKENISHSSGGASGSFFFFTEDKKFIIKTMTKTEKDGFLKMLPFLIRHLAVNGGKSLISRIYGVFKVYYKGISPIYLTLQRNNIPIEEGNEIMAKFDLKGSRFTRNVLNDDQIRKIVVDGF